MTTTNPVQRHLESIERSNKARCSICNNWTRERGCDHYEVDVHYKSFDAMVDRISNLECGIITHADFERMQGEKINQLLEALQDLVSDIKDHPSYAAREHYKPFINKALEAIKKATV